MNPYPRSADFRVSSGLALAAALIALLAMLGRALHLPDLASFLPGRSPMPIASGEAILIAALSLWLQTRGGRVAWGKVAAGAVLILGLFSMVEEALRLPFDVHRILAGPFFAGLPEEAIHPTTHAALGIVLSGIVLLLMGAERGWRLYASQSSAVLLLFGALVVLTGYVHVSAHHLVGLHRFGASPPYVLSTLLIGTGVLAAQPHRGFVAVITAQALGAAMLRRLLPFAILLPLLLGWWIVSGVDAGWFGEQFALALLSVLVTGFSVIALMGMGVRLNRKGEALHRANELLEKTFAATQTLTAYLDRDFNFLRVNRAYAVADGRSPEDFVGKNHFVLYPNAENEALFREVVQTGEHCTVYGKPFEYPGNPQRGLTYWDWSLYPVFDQGGDVEGLVLNLTDVTERHVAEARRLASEAKFHMLFNAATDAIMIVNPAGQFLEVNDVMCQRLGYSREELLAVGPAEIDSPEFAHRVPERIRQIKEQGQTVFESAHVTKGGHTFPVEISSRVIEFDDAPAILSIARDISARKAIEAALRESEEAARALIDATTESALLIGADGTLYAINETGATHFGKVPNELIGGNLYDFMTPEVSERRRGMVEQVVRTGSPLRFEEHRAGQRFEGHIYPILDDRKQVRRLAVYAKDVTERRQIQAVDGLLHEIDVRVLGGTEPDALLQFICRETTRLLQLPFAWIGRKMDDGSVAILAWSGDVGGYREQLAAVGVRWDNSPEGYGPTGLAIRTGQPQEIKVDDPAFQPWSGGAKAYGLAVTMGLPLIMRGEVYGAFTLYSQEEDAFNAPFTANLVDNLASRISVTLERAADQERMRLLNAALKATSNAIFITDRDGRIEWLNAAFSRLCGYPEAELLGQAPHILKSGRQDANYYEDLWRNILAGQSWSAETVDRRRDGSLYTVRQTIAPIFDGRHQISHFIAIQEDITEQKAAEARIHHMAHYDALTDLPNRATFYNRLAQAIVVAKSSGHQVALLFLDLDEFKSVNDTFGHHIGDLLLQTVAQRLRGSVRESDTVARLAGDEFTVVLPVVKDAAEARGVAEQIVAVFAEPFHLDGHELKVVASIGIALAPDDAEAIDDLIRLADAAMYAAKSGSGPHYCFHRPDDKGRSAPDTAEVLPAGPS